MLNPDSTQIHFEFFNRFEVVPRSPITSISEPWFRDVLKKLYTFLKFEQLLLCATNR